MERVVDWELEVIWDPNAPEAVLISDDSGRTALALNPRWDDEAAGCVVLIWGSSWSCMSEPNDEALPGHRLYDSGLKTVRWGGIVEDSALVAELARQENVMFPGQGDGYADDYTHYVLTLKECFIEVVGSKVRLHRHKGSTLDSAVVGLTLDRGA